MAVIVGAPVRIAARLYIGAFIISPDRSVDLYTKHRLGAFPPDASPNGIVPPAEATVFHPGKCAGFGRKGPDSVANPARRLVP